ncbi:MAG: type II secretion system protein [Bacilli bacterium]
MNKKGFTLIEVIMVIAIIGLLSVILVPNVIGLIEKNKIESCKEVQENIISATKIYVANNKYELGFSCGTAKEIKLADLLLSGDLNGPVINPITDTEVKSVYVEATYDCSNKTFSYNLVDDDNELNCEK